MSTPTPSSDRELVLTREIDVPAANLFRCWTEPDLMKQWFTPPPFKTVRVENEVRAGGSSFVVMEGPDGAQIECPGIYLEVIENEKIVFTDAYISAWQPSAKPFMTAIVTFEDLGNGKTRYTAIARHWSAEDREAHEKMGFHEGWGVAADQLAALAATL